MNSFKDEWCLVTGTSGYLGSAVALELSTAGWRVVGLDRTPPNNSPFLESFEVVELGRGPIFHRLRARAGRLRHVVHVAGGALEEEVSGHENTWINVMRTVQDNLISAFEIVDCTRNIIVPGGTVTLISSINAFGGYGLPAYSASKSGLHGMTRALAPELKEEGVHLQCLVLGTVDHPRVRALHSEDSQHFERMARQFPGGEIPTAQEMAVEIVNYATKSSGHTGEVRILDFGQTGYSDALH